MIETASSGTRRPVTLVCTVYNEVDTLSQFLHSVFSMSVLPTEFIVVDGGSTDGTTHLLKTFEDEVSDRGILRVIVAPDCNIGVAAGPIAKGRNLAIREARNEIVACTDAGCTLDSKWLEEITRPFQNNPTIDVVGGGYLPDARSFFERCVGLLFVLPPSAVDVKTFIPSSRSIAFRKRAWEAVGGYPELSLAGEDTKFVLDLKRMGFRFDYARDAIVYWRMRSTLPSFLRLIRKYGFGDGFLSILPSSVFKSLAKIAVPLSFICLTVLQSVWYVIPLISFWWLMPFRRRIRDAMHLNVIAKLPVLALLQLMTEFAYIAGYAKGRSTAIHPLTMERQ